MSRKPSWNALPCGGQIRRPLSGARCGLAAAAFLGGLLLAAHPCAAAGSGVAPIDTIRTPSGPLEVATFAFVKALVDLSGAEMSEAFAPEGVRLQVDGEDYAGLSSRQAVASIREFLRGYERSLAAVVRAAPVEGSPTRGSAEILWSGWASGTSHHVRRTVFVGLRRDGEVWRVDEVRFLR